MCILKWNPTIYSQDCSLKLSQIVVGVGVGKLSEHFVRTPHQTDRAQSPSVIAI